MMSQPTTSNPVEILQALPEDGIKFRIMCFALSDLFSSYNLMMCFIRSGTIGDLFQSNYRIAKLLKYLNYFRPIVLSQGSKTPACIFKLLHGAMRYLYEKDSKVQSFFGPLDGYSQGLMRGYEGGKAVDEKVAMLEKNSGKEYKTALENGRPVELNIKAMKYISLMAGLEIVKHRIVTIKVENLDEESKKKHTSHKKPALSLYLTSVLENKEEVPEKKKKKKSDTIATFGINTGICHYCTKNARKDLPEIWFTSREVSTRSICPTCSKLVFKLVTNDEVKLMLRNKKISPKQYFPAASYMNGPTQFLEYQVKQYMIKHNIHDDPTNNSKRKKIPMDVEESNETSPKQKKSKE